MQIREKAESGVRLSLGVRQEILPDRLNSGSKRPNIIGSITVIG